MTQREQKIVEATLAVILRVGMSRMTMTDIAREAGVSRQTLYVTFSLKEDLLRAAIRRLADDTLTALHTGFEGKKDLGGRLDLLFTELAAKVFDLIQKFPEARDLFTGINAACQEELDHVAQRYRQFISELLAPFAETIESRGLSVAQLSDVVERTLRALRGQARDRAHLDALLSCQKAMIQHFVGPA